jgi:Ca-activated chloride channel homolog
MKALHILAAVAALWLMAPAASGERTSAAKQVQLDVALAHPTMAIEDKSRGENHLRIALTGFDLPNEKKRMPVNVAIVIDKSGSMQGDRIEQARRAAIQAVDRLTDDDIVSVVVYDTTVEVIVPATKATDRRGIQSRIKSIRADGNTALHAGVTKGAAEVRKFLDDKRVNRVILLSDGLANVGPSSPSELGKLGASLLKEGITVSTLGLGLGYNEDLMSQLATQSSGNHFFIESADNLAEVFQREFDDVLTVVAQKIRIEARLADGIRPVKVLNYPAEIDGQSVVIEVGSLYARQERYFVLEVEIPLGQDGSKRSVGEVAVEYKNMLTETTDRLTSAVEVRFTASKELAERDVNKEVLAACVIQIANERNREATETRDRGDVEGARRLLRDNAEYLESNYRQLGVPGLQQRAELNSMQADGISGDWNRNRKAMREAQAGEAQQQRFSGSGNKFDPKP